jgi:alanine transaminase
MEQYQPVLRLDSLNPDVRRVKYEVRGQVVIHATQIATKIKEAKAEGKPSPVPFDEVIFCNIGNPQQLGQKPLTFIRQVLALLEYPELMSHTELFPADVIARAQRLLAATGCPGGTGAYSHSMGLPAVRKDVAEFLTRRDALACDPETVFLTDGASPGVRAILSLLLRDCASGVMIPIPQYPLYSATLALLGGRQVNYFLGEEQDWKLNEAELTRAYRDATAAGTEVRALVVINPSNPTGQCLSEENMRDVVRFCVKNRLVLLADEVYQENLYLKGAKFTSFRRLMHEMGAPWSTSLELVSFHSVSKGFIGECGKRGGFFCLDNVHPAVCAELYKLASISLCPNVVGQVVVDLMVAPPAPGDPSHQLYEQERAAILSSLASRARTICDALNKLEGVHCSDAAASMYLFPRVTLPPKAVERAAHLGENPDTFYCLELLNATGMCVVPGSGFGQRDGTFHFRTTFLPPPEKVAEVIHRYSSFHSQFMAAYRD